MNTKHFAWFPVYCEDIGYCWLIHVYKHDHVIDNIFYSKAELILIRNNK